MGVSSEQNFGAKLQAELDRREWGVRTLARRMAEQSEQPHRVESIRRQLRKYLGTDAVVPTTLTRHAVEDALELARDSLKPEVDPSGGRFRDSGGDDRRADGRAPRGDRGGATAPAAARGGTDVTGEAAA